MTALILASGAAADAAPQSAVAQPAAAAAQKAPFPFTLYDIPLLATGALAMLIVVACLRRFSHE